MEKNSTLKASEDSVIAKDHVTVKGTRNGILVSISEECMFAAALEHLRAAVSQQRGFLQGAPISLDLGWREVREDEYAMLTALLEEAGVGLLGIISTSLATRRLFESHGVKAIIGTLGLARHGGRARGKAAPPPPAPAAAPAPPEVEPTPAAETEQPASAVEPAPPPVDPALAPALADPTLLVRKTLRSGQRVVFPGNVVIMGDVNSGAEVEAGGDVVVMGSVRGTVHAGRGGRGSATVMALNLLAPQVRVGDLIGFVQPQKGFQHNSAVLARVQDGTVITSVFGS